MKKISEDARAITLKDVVDITLSIALILCLAIILYMKGSGRVVATDTKPEKIETVSQDSLIH